MLKNKAVQLHLVPSAMPAHSSKHSFDSPELAKFRFALGRVYHACEHQTRVRDKGFAILVRCHGNKNSRNDIWLGDHTHPRCQPGQDQAAMLLDRCAVLVTHHGFQQSLGAAIAGQQARVPLGQARKRTAGRGLYCGLQQVLLHSSQSSHEAARCCRLGQRKIADCIKKYFAFR